MARQKIVEIHVPKSLRPREKEMEDTTVTQKATPVINVATHIEEAIKTTILVAKTDVEREEARLKSLGQKVAGPFERFFRAIRAGWVAFKTMW